ncbi:UDP-N-acetyl-D-mannosaminuronic acid dehydrogenase [Halorientalis persicus]|uniref:UDP-N-acetyl-D-mannosamine dehydrogenase n=1 Tax=Halorientalis persicus TaxID=1367881 RepID=A0A1H8V565_9EURY|nr:nucleotide sugar dehydrogenase [Halorientalis persicus]SEP10367.1 UDP-N-acetyl-D-mannosaminuronic acid dehydrogenase [Halorientalis persicus]
MSTIYVHGLGYIGLPTAAMFANYDHEVTGYDTDEAVIEGLDDGNVHIDEPGLRAFVTQALESGNLTVSNEVDEAKYHIIAVPTPFDDETKEPTLEYVEAAGEAIAPHLRPGDTVILESTVPPGTTVETLQPALEQSGLDAGSDFALVHCPETVLPGNIITELKENDRIIGGVNGVSTEAAVRLYESFVEGDIYTTENATTAEFVKLIQNTYRDVNIALANELALIGEDYGIDSREAIEMANTHPRVDIHHPGPGVGGHCLPIDPWFLGQNSDNLDLIERARAINDGMADHVVETLRDELGSLEGRTIAVFGVAYKGNVGDTRQSPGLDLAQALQKAEAELASPKPDGGVPPSAVGVRLHDPHVADQTLDLVDRKSAIAGADAVVITADHDEFEHLDPAAFADAMAERVVVDTKDVLDPSEWKSEGFSVRRI